MIWSIIRTIGRQGITFILFVILALLLDPKDFGILGMAMAWITFVSVFSEMGFGTALIQRENVNSKHFSTIFFVNVAVGIFLTIIGIILSWPCALFFKTQEVQPIMAVLSLGFIINSFSLTQMALTQKELRFRDLAIRDISASLIGGILGIILALLKFGVWSLVIQTLTTYLIGSVLLWYISKWRPRLKEFSFKCVKDLWEYSSRIFAFQIFKFFAQNTDKLLIGYCLGPVALGLYVFAFKIVVYPISTVVGAIGNYLFPKYSKMQEDLQSINKSYQFVVKSINSVVAPLMVIIAFLSPILIPFIWGQRWVQTVPLIQIFTILAISQSLISPVGQLMKALNRPGWLFNWAVFITVVVFAFIWTGIYYRGIVGAAYGITIAYILGIPINLFIVRKLIHINFRDILSLLFPSILASLIMIVSLWMVQRINIVSINLKLIAGLSFSVLLYFVTMIWIDKLFLLTIFKRLVKFKLFVD